MQIGTGKVLNAAEAEKMRETQKLLTELYANWGLTAYEKKIGRFASRRS